MCSGAPGQNMPKSLQLWMTEALSRKQTGAVSLLASGTLFDLSYLILFVPIHTNPLFFTKPKDKAVLTPEMPPMFPSSCRSSAVIRSQCSNWTGERGKAARALDMLDEQDPAAPVPRELLSSLLLCLSRISHSRILLQRSFTRLTRMAVPCVAPANS